ncbi:MAG: CBS domain-containing protein, partial [Cystobacter sp.]
MDGRAQGMDQEWVSKATTLFGGDTIVAALRVMRELGVNQLPVVDEERGELLGEITSEELSQWWKVSPLASMEEILSGRFGTDSEEEAFERPFVRDV